MTLLTVTARAIKKVVYSPLDFVEDAICLNGLTGMKLKCDVKSARVTSIYFYLFTTFPTPIRKNGKTQPYNFLFELNPTSKDKL
jgi:hypothetical protein